MIHITVDCDDDFFIQNKVYYKGKFETFEDLMKFMQENVKSKQKKVRAYDYLLDCKTHRDTGYDQNDNMADKAVWWLTDMLPRGIAQLADRLLCGEKNPKFSFGGNWETTIEVKQ